MSETRLWLRINDGTPTPAFRGRTLLSCLHEAGVFPPSACGGRGLCGLCKVRVTSESLPPHSDAELKKLTEAERAEGLRLACQILVETDLEVRVPEAYLLARRYPVRLDGVETLCHDTKRFRLAFLGDESFSFTAGQYIRLAIPPHGGRAQAASRAYSIASPPTERGHIELIVRRVPQGVATGYLHDTAQVGDTLEVDGPYGDFGLRRTPAEAIFVAGGSGIAPFESILAEAGRQGLAKPITFLLGAVHRNDLYDLEKIAALGSRLPAFRLVPSLSCAEPGDGWEGERGLVTDVAKRLFPSFTGKEAYLCGSPGMIEACRKLFLAGGMRESDISYDLFG